MTTNKKIRYVPADENAIIEDLMARWYEKYRATPEHRLDQELKSWWRPFGGEGTYAQWLDKQVQEPGQTSCRDFLRRPRYNFGHLKRLFPTLTYRQINHWEEHGLITPNRVTDDTGWRKFSDVDIVCLAIIKELRAHGLGLPTIRDDLFSLMSQETHLFDDSGRIDWARFTYDGDLYFKNWLTRFELYIFKSANHNVGVIRTEHEGLTIAPADALIPCMSLLMQQRNSFIYIPISEYVRSAIALDDGNPPPINPGLVGMLAKGYANILWLIQASNTEAVTVTKSANGKINVKQLSRRTGCFSEKDILSALGSDGQCKIEVYKKDGRIVTITVEEKSQIE